MGRIEEVLKEGIRIKEALMGDDTIRRIADLIISTYKEGRKVVVFGNGGSAADAQHFAAELVGRFKMEREALSAIALTTDTSILTSIANDYGYESVFSRQVDAHVKEGDCVVGISTSGTSKNVLCGIQSAKRRGAKTVALTGQGGGRLREMVDICLMVPSKDTPRIQEAHITCLHIICDLVEEALFG
jgi:D-sedoheptulose 7-phosphate isomerase